MGILAYLFGAVCICTFVVAWSNNLTARHYGYSVLMTLSSIGIIVSVIVLTIVTF